MSLKQKFGNSLISLAGWKILTPSPNVPRYVAIAAPHTSNWDGYHLIVVGMAANVKLRWLGKHTLFRPPFGGVLKRLGGIPVRRSKHMGLVEQVAEFIKSQDEIVVFVPPEGTRSRVETWKSGFYHIAMAAEVPIIPTYIDYARKEAAFGEPIYPTGDLKADMDKLRAFYDGVQGRHPELFADPKLRDE